MTRPDTPREAEFRQIVRDLLERGIKPTPMELHRRHGDRFVQTYPHMRRSGPSLKNGQLTRIRREEFIRAGWVEQGNKWVQGGELNPNQVSYPVDPPTISGTEITKPI